MAELRSILVMETGNFVKDCIHGVLPSIQIIGVLLSNREHYDHTIFSLFVKAHFIHM
jgi:hypothetical protein